MDDLIVKQAFLIARWSGQQMGVDFKQATGKVHLL